MSSYGFTDGQEITGWLGVPFEEATGRVIGAGSYVAGPFTCTNFASVVVAVKATGGNVTVKVTQSVASGPGSLQLAESIVVAAGGVDFEAFVLFGDTFTVEFDGSVAGTSIDYAIYPSNTTTNAQVITAATINVQHNDVLVAAEPTLDFEDPAGGAWTIVDDAPNTRVKITPPITGLAPLGLILLAAPAATMDFSSIPATYQSLLLEAFVRSAIAGTGDDCYVRLNADAGANYTGELMFAKAAAVTALDIFGGLGTAGIYAGICPGATSAADDYAAIALDLPNYTAAHSKVVRSRSGGNNTRAAGQTFVADSAGEWISNVAVNELTLRMNSGNNFATGSWARLWGKA